MKLQEIERVSNISHEDFRNNYFLPRKPVILTDATKNWPAVSKWSNDYFKSLAGDIEVPLYDNSIPKADSKLNAPDAVMKFGDYLDLISSRPTELRIFLFNIFNHIPSLCDDFTYPEVLSTGFLKRFPMMFFGGTGSKVFLHYDIDLSHVFITQFTGKKKVILFDNKYSPLLYRLPFTVQSYIDPEDPDYEKFPALRKVEGYTSEIGHGEMLFMPSGMWHYMNYLEGGYALSLRSIENSFSEKVRGAYNLFLMRRFDDFMKKTVTQRWYRYKHRKAAEVAKSRI